MSTAEKEIFDKYNDFIDGKVLKIVSHDSFELN